MKRNIIKVSLLKLIPILLIAMIPLLLSSIDIGSEANAAAVADVTAEQVGKVDYCGKDYVSGGKFADMDGKNDLFSALRFYYNGAETELSPDDVTVSLSSIIYPNTYSATLTVNIYGETYECETDLTISKRDLKVIALVNGQSRAVIKEGETYTTSIVYEGFAEGDGMEKLDSPALIDTYPKMPTSGNGYDIVPKYAESQYYNIITVAAKLIINSNPDSQRIQYSSDGTAQLVLNGSFSPYYELQYREIGLNSASVEYTEIEEKVEKYYGNIGLFDDYNEADAYRINMLLDGNVRELTDPIIVRIKLPDNMTGKSEYRVIHFANDGSHTLITQVAERDGYVIFTSVGLGDYVLLTPIEGANTVMTVAICVGIVLGVVLIVLLFAVFRRKY